MNVTINPPPFPITICITENVHDIRHLQYYLYFFLNNQLINEEHSQHCQTYCTYWLFGKAEVNAERNERGWIDTAPVSHRYCTSGFGLQTCRLFERHSRQTSSCLGCSLSMTRKEGPSFTFCSLFGASSWFPRHIIFGPGNP